MADSILKERDRSTRESIEDGHSADPGCKTRHNTQVYKEYEKQDHLDESVSFDDNENKESYI